MQQEKSTAMWITAYVLAILDNQAVFKQLTSAWKMDKAAMTPMICPYFHFLLVIRPNKRPWQEPPERRHGSYLSRRVCEVGADGYSSQQHLSGAVA